MPFRDQCALVVDDQYVVTTLLSKMLERLGFSETVVARDGQAALTRLRERRFDLVLSDVKMEPMSGLKLLAAIRQDEALKATKVVLTTADRDPSHVLAAKRLKADSFLLKPFSAETLRERLLRTPTTRRAPA